MRRVLLGVLLATLAGVALRAQDDSPAMPKESKAGEELRALKKEYWDVYNKFSAERLELAKQYQATKDEAERKALKKKLTAWVERTGPRRPLVKFGPRFLRFAEKNSKDPAGVEAVELVLTEASRWKGVPKEAGSPWERAVGVLDKHFVAVPGVRQVLPLLAHSGDPAGERFVRAVLAKNPDRLTRAGAAQALANAFEEAAMTAAQLEKDEAVRKAVESNIGKEAVEKLIARGKESRQRGAEMKALIGRDYGDIIPDLSVGKKAPDVKCLDLEGKAVKLSDFRGKVVVLDFWKTSCVPCLAMIPHQRALVEKLKGKPFALISINVDMDKDRLTKSLEKRPMPWTHWRDTSKGGIAEVWSVHSFPTIYILDAKGVIRHKDLEGTLTGERLEKAVKALLEETDR
jgi:thiol-disulfide isomerase/thioredoxin